MLHLSIQVGMPDTDVAVVMHVHALDTNDTSENDAWPEGYFESVVGSMPDLTRPPQGSFEERPIYKISIVSP
jgi:hypothetical protein